MLSFSINEHVYESVSKLNKVSAKDLESVGRLTGDRDKLDELGLLYLKNYTTDEPISAKAYTVGVRKVDQLRQASSKEVALLSTSEMDEDSASYPMGVSEEMLGILDSNIEAIEDALCAKTAVLQFKDYQSYYFEEVGINLWCLVKNAFNGAASAVSQLKEIVQENTGLGDVIQDLFRNYDISKVEALVTA